MDAEGTRQPKGRGSLFETPFCHLVLYLYRHAQDGTLVLSVNGEETTIRFQRGRPTAARFPAPAARLLDGLLPLCGLLEGQFAFYDGDLLGTGDDVMVAAIDPYELLAASLENHARDDMVDALLARFSGQSLRLLKGRDLERMRIRPALKPFLDLIRAAPATPEELITQTELPKQTARRLLYALIAAHMVSADDRRAQETFRSQLEMPKDLPSAPSALPMDPADRSSAWKRLASLRPSVSLRPGGSAPPVSFIPPPARTPQISIRPAAPTPGVSIRPRAATPTSLMPAADDAQGRLRRAEQLLSRGRHDDAIAEVKALIDEGIKGADVLALHAHLLFEKHSLQQEDGLPRHVLEAIKRAADLEPDHPRTLFVKGLVAKAAGDTKKALAYFKRVLQSDPKHLDAQRELRLAKLRMEDG